MLKFVFKKLNLSRANMWMFRIGGIGIKDLFENFEWLCSRVLATHHGGFDSRSGHVSLGTSSLRWR
jgi:hypothetical protein